MKRLFLITLISLVSIFAFGQNDGALKFLGIPIDGTESQFTAKLRSKGFAYNSYSESYKGQFNGKNVDVYIHTNHNLVDRVYVTFPPTTEENIRIDFNILLSQFKQNSKYMDLSMNEEIPETDDISYEIKVNKKRYQSSFSYFDPDRDPLSFVNALIDKFDGLLPTESINKWNESMSASLNLSEDDQKLQSEQMMAELQSAIGNIDEKKAILFLATFFDGMKSLADGDVWFMIHENYGRYNIGLYYDNLHNQANGEDL